MNKLCTQPCKPIVDDLNRRDALLKSDDDERERKINKKIDRVVDCIETKIPSRLFWKAVGFGAFFIFIFVGGMLWSLKGTISEIDTNVKVLGITFNRTENSLERYVIKTDNKIEKLEDRVGAVERGETYYRYHDLEKEKE